MIATFLAAFAVVPGLLGGVGVVATPSDAHCPARAQLVGALAARVPDEVVGWVAAYAVEVDGSAAQSRIRFELHDRDGNVRLRRELTVGDGGCAEAADGLAMIVERYFEGVAWTAEVPLPEIERKPEPDARATRPVWELQAGLAARSEPALVPALAVDARLPLPGGWWLVGGFLLPTRVSTPVEGLVAHLDTLHVRTSVRWRAARRALAADVGPAVTVAVERVTGTPAFTNGSSYRGVVAAGAVASGRWWLSPAWALGIEVEADATLYAPSFVLTGHGEVLPPAPVSFLGLLAISCAFSR